jgi:hypothetical protein
MFVSAAAISANMISNGCEFAMSAVLNSRGRVLSSEQVRFNTAPVRLGQQLRCHQDQATVSVRTDPETGDLLAIVVHCGCGEEIMIDCQYDAEAS